MASEYNGVVLTKALFARQRIEVPLSEIGILNPVFIARTNYLKTYRPLISHSHASIIEVFYIARGHQVFESGGAYLPTSAGDFYVNMPGEKHGTGNMPQERNILYWYQVDLSPGINSLSGLNNSRSNSLLSALSKIKKKVFPANKRVPELFDEIIQTSNSKMAYQRERIEVLLVSLILETLSCEQEGQGRWVSKQITECCEYIHNHLTEDIRIDSLASLFNLSPSNLKERFASELGIPPKEYILRQKIEFAKKLLNSGRSATDVAFRLGFSSSQYFATVFKRFTGLKPVRRTVQDQWSAPTRL